MSTHCGREPLERGCKVKAPSQPVLIQCPHCGRWTLIFPGCGVCLHCGGRVC